MKVSIYSREVRFQLSNHRIEVYFKSYGGHYIYIDGYEMPCRIDVIEDIINNERIDLIKKLLVLAKKYRDPRTRAKYVDKIIEKGSFKSSRELTSELRKRADVKTRSGIGFRFDELRGWLFTGRSGRDWWRAYFIPDDVSYALVLTGEDVYVKETVLSILDGDYEKFKEFDDIKIGSMDYYTLNSMREDAEKWGIKEMQELVGMMTMMINLSR